MPLPSNPNSGLLDAITARLAQEGWVRRRGKEGRTKLLGHCLFHADGGRPNADFYPDDGWYKCWVCDEVFSPEEVADTLGISADMKMGQPQGAGPVMSRGENTSSLGGYHNRFGHPKASYRYLFPDGRLSHLKHRYEAEGSKTFLIQAPDGSWTKPVPNWPIYGLQTLPPGSCIIILEGEKAQELVNQSGQIHDGKPIFALTMGSSADMLSAEGRKVLLKLLQDLKVHRVLVWPDNDAPGKKWAKPLHILLQTNGIRSALVNVTSLDLPEGAGCDDFLDKGGDLDSIFTREFQQVGGYTVDEIIQQTIVTRSGLMVMPGSRDLHPIKDDSVELAIFRATKDSTPTTKIRQRVRNELRSRAVDSDIDIYYRRWHSQQRDAFAWRSMDHGFAYLVNRDGVRAIQDPPRSLLILPQGALQVASGVDLDGRREALEKVCDFFGIRSSLEILECWLLCALIGLQTPILLLRGEAGSGKTTLAKVLVGILEPTVPQAQFTNNKPDERALINGLQRSMAVLVDNVSSMPTESEDVLSRFVTGYGVLHRPLYEDRTENIAMQRAIVLTTVNYNMRKGDLVSRTVAIRTHAYDRYKDEDQVEAFLNPLIEQIRGYLFHRAAFYYQQIHINPNGTSSLRLAGLSRIFRALGYNAEKIERQLALNRVQVTSETDPWLNAVVDWLHAQNLQVNEQRQVRLEEIKGSIEGLTDQFLPSNQKFAAFLYEASPQFRDHGFTLQRGRTNQMRFWQVRKLHEVEYEDE